jgi:hypothetical protein
MSPRWVALPINETPSGPKYSGKIVMISMRTRHALSLAIAWPQDLIVNGYGGSPTPSCGCVEIVGH